MKFEPIEVKDKLNRTIVIRSAIADDAEDLIKYLKVTTEETPYLIREPDEVAITHEQEVAFINNFRYRNFTLFTSNCPIAKSAIHYEKKKTDSYRKNCLL